MAAPDARRALGRLGRPVYGSRALATGAVGWYVVALQFSLAAHGFPGGPVDGALGPRAAGALQRFQRWAGLAPDGVADPATLRALDRAPPRAPVRLRRPVQARSATASARASTSSTPASTSPPRPARPSLRRASTPS